MRFYLGTHMPSWLSKTEVPLFVSRGPLKRLVTFPRAHGPWALDSGGFTEIGTHGRWTVSPADYAREVRLWQREIGNLDWAAPQDWMCEPAMLLRSLLADGYVDGVRERRHDEKAPVYLDYLAKKAKEFPIELLRQRVCVHQNRTIENLIALRELAPEVPWAPVLQGLFPEDYVAHAKAYLRAGVNLKKEPIVGLGSVCRRQRLDDAHKVIAKLAGPGWKLRLHGFGLKTDSFKDPIMAAGLASADSVAWSLGASMRRRQGKMCVAGRHSGGCGNCIHFALEWRARVLETWERTMFGKERSRGRGKIAANPDDWEDLPPMFAPAPPNFTGSFAGSSSWDDLPPVFDPSQLPPRPEETSLVVASTSPGLRFPAYQAELLQKGIPVKLDVPQGLDAAKNAENLMAACNELSGSGDPVIAYLMQTGVVGDTLFLPDHDAAKVLHRAVLKIVGDPNRPRGLRTGALRLIEKIEAATGIHPQQGLHDVAVRSGISMLQLWRAAESPIAVCKPFAVNVRERRALLRLIADDSSAVWMKGILDTFPTKFQELYSAAWKRAHEEFNEDPENEYDALSMRHGFALQEAWYGFAEILTKAGAEACVTDRTVCGCGNPDHNIIIYRRPGAPGWYSLGIPYWIWEDPPQSGHCNVEFCRNFAEGNDFITDDQWGFNAYQEVTEEEWREFCYGDEYGFDEGYAPYEESEPEPEPEPVKPKKKPKKKAK